MTDRLSDTILVRASSFGGAANHYDRFRPPPPVDAASWVLAGAATGVDGPVVELGAGTGLFTRRLATLGVDVVAVEPDRRMAAVLAGHAAAVLAGHAAAVLAGHAAAVLAGRSSRPSAVLGRAERLPVAAGISRAVVVSSAWHWMDPERTSSEAARVLRPGGVLGIVGNGPDRSVPWVAHLVDDVRSSGPEPAGGEPAGRRPVRLPAGAPFTDPETAEITWSLPVERDDLLGLVATYSRFLVLGPAERAELLASTGRRIDEVAGDLDRVGWQLPLRCRCWRAVRR